MAALGLVLSAIGSIFTGVTSLKESNETAEALQDQGRLSLGEALRDASIIREEGREFAASQSLQFIGAGVELAGSALITLRDTKEIAEAEAIATEAKGAARADLAFKQADISRAGGRADLISGIIGGVATLVPKKK